jgi:hypothetical protein
MPKLSTTDEQGNEYEIGTVEQVHLGYEDHGLFAFGVNFKFEGSGQGTGLYGLPEDSPSSIRLIKRVTDVIGPITEARGKKVFAIRAAGDRFGKIIGIAPLEGEPVFFEDIFKEQ